MTDETWKKTLALLDENERRIKKLPAADPIPSAELCKDSPHLTLGHLTSCQAAWLVLMRAIRDGKSKASLPLRPNPLYTKLGFGTAEWKHLRKRFIAERAEWRSLLQEVKVAKELLTERRTWTAQLLTKRLVDHEKHHLDTLL